jgi:hypothetical protein
LSKIISQTKSKLEKLKEETEKNIYQNIKDPIVFPPPPVEVLVLNSEKYGSSKKTKRLQRKKPGRPKLSA